MSIINLDDISYYVTELSNFDFSLKGLRKH